MSLKIVRADVRRPERAYRIRAEPYPDPSGSGVSLATISAFLANIQTHKARAGYERDPSGSVQHPSGPTHIRANPHKIRADPLLPNKAHLLLYTLTSVTFCSIPIIIAKQWRAMPERAHKIRADTRTIPADPRFFSVPQTHLFLSTGTVG